MEDRQKCLLAGPATGCRTPKVACIEKKKRVRQPAVRYTQQNKTKKNKYIHAHTHKYACWCVWLHEERQRIRVRPPPVRYTQKSKQSNMHTCVSVNAYVYEKREWISVTLVTTAAQGCASDLCMPRCVRARVCWHYFANLSAVPVRLPMHTVTQKHSFTHTL